MQGQSPTADGFIVSLLREMDALLVSYERWMQGQSPAEDGFIVSLLRKMDARSISYIVGADRFCRIATVLEAMPREAVYRCLGLLNSTQESLSHECCDSFRMTVTNFH